VPSDLQLITGSSIIELFEKLLIRAALGTDPVIGQVFKGSPHLNIAGGITFGGIIDITTGAFVTGHTILLVSFIEGPGISARDASRTVWKFVLFLDLNYSRGMP
jgi:hypothetical protein